ncbi:MAG: hypothetical protein UY44_C0015G0020 [Candidatus Kaiserbacteria bacterium GW2011_GWA2_49_19]|uniref:Dephospho-CoA kinase n=2 Tax=Candidatus Kaiseribacteriota TaxID=1752734 RepID=A0A0G1YPC4_9BACT|nr:MAG: hypothetical protein UY44_C0015G0020 [Candidatus Kaiserbacteria bacterium GW2011_GWA2_49_19]OGG59502.1 MAG: hypothetical protein A3C86_04270 [Candidatus Kaiserbacteria bacterium RIFCSPHIGHO2_02_FULL_49_16]
MKKAVLVTGASGSGKSTLSEKLNEMGYKAYDVDAVPGLCTLIDTSTNKPPINHDNANLKKVKNIDWICDKRKLADIVNAESADISFYCGAASNADELYPLFDLIILLTVDESVARHRLTHRTANDFARTSEVQDWIMGYKNKWDEKTIKKGALPVDANRNIDAVAWDVIRVSLEQN